MFLQQIRRMYAGAIADGLARDNPAQVIKNPRRQGRSADSKEPFTGAEVVALMNAASGPDRDLIVLLLGTGVRPGEMLAVRRQDVDLKRRKLVIGASLSRFGEGPTKTAGSARIVDLLDVVAPVISAVTNQLSVPRIHGPLFANQAGRFLNYTNWRDRNWHEIVTKAGIPYRPPGTCRHTYAVRMLDAGYAPSYVASQMGHTGPQMIYRHYARWAVGLKAEEAQR
jgi:integrase